MARIIIASASEQVRSQLRGLLVSSGFSVFRLCESGSSLRRTINECEDGIVIFSGPLPDCKPEELQWDYGDRIQILLVGKPPVLDACESPDIFRLVLPTTGQALIGAVNMLSIKCSCPSVPARSRSLSKRPRRSSCAETG